MITAKLDGWKETASALKDLPNKVQRNVIKQAMNRAAKMVADLARTSNAFRDRTGNLRKSIEVRQRKAESTRLGADVVAKSPHAHLIESGWQQKTAKGSRHIPGTFFLTNALRDNEKDILAYTESELRRYIQRRLTRTKR